MNQRHPNRSGIPYCPPPAVKPVDVGRHGRYETGKGLGGTQDFHLSQVAFEALSAVSIQPAWLMIMNIAFATNLGAPVYALIFDLNANNPEQLALITTNANAPWTLGPVPNGGGSIMFGPESERIPDDVVTGDDLSIGIPFNFGITVVLSTTPRVLTRLGGDQNPTAGMAIIARIKV